MATSHHLQIINQSYYGGEDVLFGQFPMLPTELRQRIWQCSVERHRLLEVKLDPPPDSGNAPLYSTTNALNKLISSRNYTATVQGLQLHSKLLRVNSESREVALRFYRVHIPCYLQKSENGIKKTIRTTLYFNPEYDFMDLRTRGPEYPIVDFLHDLKAYDPQDVGLLNLALDTNSMTHLHSLTNISEVAARVSLVASLSQLQQLIWIAHSHSGRAIMGQWQGFQGVGVQFNHSMPIKAIRPSFNLLRRDPRPVGPELKCVLTGSYDPRRMRVQWRELLQRWQIRQVQPTRERVLFAYEPPSYEQQVCDIRTADKFLREEEAKWLELQQAWKVVVRRSAGKVPIEGPEELAKAVRPAIGFWLFPAEALGGLDGDLPRKNVFDMTGHWPELALSCLS